MGRRTSATARTAPRRKVRHGTGGLPDDLGEELAALALDRHALNVLIRNYDWYRALEVVDLEGLESVSQVVRRALETYLDTHPARDVLQENAVNALTSEIARKHKRRQYVESQTSE